MGNWTPTNIAWLAGIIEGEGYIGDPNKGRIVVNVFMADEDVVRKCFAVTGLGGVTGPEIRGTNLPMFRWKVSRAADVYAVCAAIYQFMGQRRGARIESVLRWYTTKPPVLINLHGTATRYKRFRCRCDACRLAYSVYWAKYTRRSRKAA